MPRRRRGWLWRRGIRLNLKQHTVVSIAQIFFFSLAGIVILSFSRQGGALIWLNDLLLAYLAWTAILVPFLLIVSGLMLSKFKTPFSQPTVLVGGTILFIALTGITQAGIIGRQIWDSVSVLITDLGAFVILLGALVIGFLVLFNTSLDHVLAFVISLLVALRRRILADETTSVLHQTKLDFKVAGGGSLDTSREAAAERVKKEEKPAEEGTTSLKRAVNPPREEGVWEYPPLSLLSESVGGKADRGDIKANADKIERTLDSFGIESRVVEVNLGPAVTQYALEVGLGTKLSRITNLANDLALALAAPSGMIRIEAPIPGRSLVGIEVPNRSPEFVGLRQMLESEQAKSNKSKLMVALGLDVAGQPVIADIAKMPHLLIAGQTGSGKSVALNAFISSILFRASPSEVKFILVDPKRVELTGYNNIPHLLAPVITEAEKVLSALKYLISEMEQRYKMFAEVGARNIDAYNEISGFQALPYIVLIIDELADIMLFSPGEVEGAITRLAQMSRATGIHMVLATQRPSVDILTGLIKANIPARMAFAVSSQVDSRVILDTPGAEKLLGRGDMLYLPPDQAKPIRIQGTYVSDRDISALINFLKKSGVAPQYTEEVTSTPASTEPAASAQKETDVLFEEAVRIVCATNKASASLLQRRLSIGYARAARILDQLEAAGVVGPAEGSKPREILISDPDSFLSQQNTAQEETN